MNGVVGSGNGPEFQIDSEYIGQYDIEWVDIKNLPNMDLKPESIKKEVLDERLNQAEK